MSAPDERSLIKRLRDVAMAGWLYGAEFCGDESCEDCRPHVAVVRDADAYLAATAEREPQPLDLDPTKCVTAPVAGQPIRFPWESTAASAEGDEADRLREARAAERVAVLDECATRLYDLIDAHMDRDEQVITVGSVCGIADEWGHEVDAAHSDKRGEE